VVVAGLALLFFVLAEYVGPVRDSSVVASSLASWNAKNPYVNDALSGVLAVVIASPARRRSWAPHSVTR
jgi:hypothetical protein